METARRRSTTPGGPAPGPSPCSRTRRRCACTRWRSRRSGRTAPRAPDSAVSCSSPSPTRRAGPGTTRARSRRFLRAAELARSAQLPEMLARAAAGYGGRFLWAHALTDERLVPLLEDGLSALGEEDSVLRVQLLSRLAAALRHGPSRERRERIIRGGAPDRAQDRRPRNARLRARRRGGRPARTPHRRQAAGRRRGDRLPRQPRTGDRERLFDGHEHSFWAAWELGDPDRRAAELASMTRVAEELRQPAQLWALAVAQATLALSQGRFAEAPELIERAAAIGERVLGVGRGGGAQAAALPAASRAGTTRRLRARGPGPRGRVSVAARARGRSRARLRPRGAHRRGGGPPPRAHAPRPLGLARRRGVARQHLPARGDLRNPR